MDNLTELTLTPGITSDRTTRWLEAGYDLFIIHGQCYANVEQVARVLGRNKSAFYHFFGDRETYLQLLLAYHMTKVNSFIDEIKGIDQYDPHYIDLLIKHQRIILFNCQLMKNAHHQLCEHTLQEINARIDEYLLPIWSKYIGLEHDPDLSRRYHTIIRDYIYIKLTAGSFRYDFITTLASEAKLIISGLTKNVRISTLTSNTLIEIEKNTDPLAYEET